MSTGQRRTKIVATMGPATESEAAIDSLMKAGVDVLRLNFSHGTADEHIARAEKIRRIGLENHRHLAILADLQGPKIRLRKFKQGSIDLDVGDHFCLDTECADGEGDISQVGVTYAKLPQDVKKKDILVLDDGRIVLQVDAVEGTRISCTVQVGGELSDNKGINLKGGGLTAAVLTEKDKADIKTAALINADYVAVSFPRNAADMTQARKLLEAEGSSAGLVAKIERAEALENLDEIIEASDALMIARGDLGVEIDPWKLPELQKWMIDLCNQAGKPVITATQMLESMIDNPHPNRADVSDIANAIFDGTDVIMLSGETSIGKYPVACVRMMRRISDEVEKTARFQEKGLGRRGLHQ